MLNSKTKFFQRILLSGIIAYVLSSAFTAFAQPVGYKTRDVITGVNIPWEITWGYDNWIWFTERYGSINRVNPLTGERKMLLRETDVRQLHESGMLGMDFHPSFPDSPFVYVAYTYVDSSIKWQYPIYLKVVRYTYGNDTLSERTTIIDKIQGNYAHNGSRIFVTDDRKIFVTTGDHYTTPEWAQMDSLPNGKVLRYNIDGTIPDDNPWHGSPNWTKGHRNIQGLCFGPTGTLYTSEHGDYLDDEVNIIHPKNNYGWPGVEGFCDSTDEMQFCNDSNVTEPLYSWSPTVAVCGMEYYTSDLYPDWQNSLLVATLKDSKLHVLQLDSTGKKVLGILMYWMWMTSDTLLHAGRLRDVCISPDGRVFISTSNSQEENMFVDRIFEIIPDNIKDVKDDPNKTAIIALSPNPATDNINISGLPGKSIIEIYDVLGKAIYSSTSSSNETTISVGNIASGAYYVRIMSDNGVQTIPVIIK
jgi:glucose/arabinose dehydrogenase